MLYVQDKGIIRQQAQSKEDEGNSELWTKVPYLEGSTYLT